MEIEEFKKINPKYLITGAVIIILIILFIALNPFVIIRGGEVGVVMTLGKIQEEVLPEGMHFIIPQVQDVVRLDVTTQALSLTADAPSKSLLKVESRVILNYKIDPDKAWLVYKKFRDVSSRKRITIVSRIIEPSMQEVIKDVMGQYSEGELIDKRKQISDKIKNRLAVDLKLFNILVVKVSMGKFTFSEKFTEAISNKQEAKQRALQATRDLERIKTEAKQKIASARAEAESLRIQKQNITPNLIKLRQIEATMEAIKKWDGHLPSVTAGALPFIDVRSFKK